MSRKGSQAPITDAAPEWLGMLPREIEAKVAEMAKDGTQPAKIGLVLRDSFGVPDVKQATGKSITTIIAEAGQAPSIPQDLTNLIHRAIDLQEHLKNNRQDLHNKRGLELIEARIRKLAKYYQKHGKLATTWKYTRDGARLLVD